MRRIISVLAVAALMAAMLLATAAPAFAEDSVDVTVTVKPQKHEECAPDNPLIEACADVETERRSVSADL
jgi:uncharacterized protein YggE